MKYKIQRWYYTNHNEITWFLIGWLALSAIHAIINGNWFGALLAGGLAYLNYAINSSR